MLCSSFCFAENQSFIRFFASGSRASAEWLFSVDRLLLIVLTCDIVMGKLILLSAGLLAKISVLWLFHSISMAAFFVLLDLFAIRRFVPGMLFLLEGVTFMIGCRICTVSHAMYGMWGMYLRSSLYETGGFPVGVIMVTEAVLQAASFAIGQKYLKKETDYI